MSEDRCTMCGEVIPEGRQVCPTCEHKVENAEHKLHRYGLMRFSKRTGKIDQSMVGWGKGLLKLWGLQNTTKSKATLVFDLDDRKTEVEYIGTEDFPTVHDKEEDFEYAVSDQIYDEMSKGFERHD